LRAKKGEGCSREGSGLAMRKKKGGAIKGGMFALSRLELPGVPNAEKKRDHSKKDRGNHWKEFLGACD